MSKRRRSSKSSSSCESFSQITDERFNLITGINLLKLNKKPLQPIEKMIQLK